MGIKGRFGIAHHKFIFFTVTDASMASRKPVLNVTSISQAKHSFGPKEKKNGEIEALGES